MALPSGPSDSTIPLTTVELLLVFVAPLATDVRVREIPCIPLIHIVRRVADVRASRSSYTKSRNTVRDHYNLPGFLVAASCDCIVPEVCFGFSCRRLKHRDGVFMVIFVCCFGCFSFLTKCKTVSFFTYFFRRNKICQQYTYLRENRYLLVFCYECR